MIEITSERILTLKHTNILEQKKKKLTIQNREPTTVPQAEHARRAVEAVLIPQNRRKEQERGNKRELRQFIPTFGKDSTLNTADSFPSLPFTTALRLFMYSPPV